MALLVSMREISIDVVVAHPPSQPRVILTCEPSGIMTQLHKMAYEYDCFYTGKQYDAKICSNCHVRYDIHKTIIYKNVFYHPPIIPLLVSQWTARVITSCLRSSTASPSPVPTSVYSFLQLTGGQLTNQCSSSTSSPRRPALT